MTKHEHLRQLVMQWEEAARSAHEAAKRFAEALAEVIQPVVPELEYHVGADAISLYCDKFAYVPSIVEEPLVKWLEWLFPFDCTCVEAPRGIWLGAEEMEKLKKALEDEWEG